MRSHSGHSSPPPATVRAYKFYRQNTSAISSLSSAATTITIDNQFRKEGRNNKGRVDFCGLKRLGWVGLLLLVVVVFFSIPLIVFAFLVLLPPIDSRNSDPGGLLLPLLLGYVPCIFIARRIQHFLPSFITSYHKDESFGRAYQVSTKHRAKSLTHQTGNYPVTCFVSRPSGITLVKFLPSSTRVELRLPTL